MQRTNNQEALHAREAQLQALLLRAQDGDSAAYKEFLSALGIHLRGFLRRRLPQHADEIEDLLQEVLLAVHNARHTYRVEQPLTVWVQAIARYKLADYFRGYARRGALHQPLDDADELFEAEDQEPAQASRDLSRLLQQLPDRQRLPILHVKLEGLSVEETAQLTGLSSSAVKVGIHRGLKALASLIRGNKENEN
ncbi:sigma-70 family RNA polymerase sigma factor [Pseudomonas sp. CNPSo 3701]|uniref:sigma-70 family RNA polymerase sigma factor n=1 Tax=Pseudomonas sp. CNPSo 3701 TaxID=3027943 RepID=UPI00236393DD|nr:sigma-70 family RNA polymerase sigma factor [Pseudomonas sp. CNPSo 3701]MDD1508240.1 sigma-70 family RNA polymerase sigma factor [Pseudomonas sp. CNPSo 3701]